MRKNRILMILIVIAIALIGSSIIIQLTQTGKIWEELSKTLMTLGATVVLGGLLKFLLDDFKKEIEKEDKRKEFIKELVNELRKIYDEVELSRLLIDSHKSAKTYGERIRDGIIPSKMSLYNLKRTLVDSHEFFPEEEIQKIRLTIHFMIAYLQSLVQEYQEHYFNLSNLQSYQEKIKENSKNFFSDLLFREEFYPDDYQSLKKINQLFDEKKRENKIPGRLLTVWKEIDGLFFLNDFLKAEPKSNYYKLFFSQYEYCKKLIRNEMIRDIKPPSPSLENKYLKILVKNDEASKKGKTTPDFNLVLEIFDNEF